MRTDIILDNKNKSHRIIIDTKFTNIFHNKSSWYREKSLKSGYIYQLYAYLRSQEGIGEELFDNSSGMLLHPAIGEDINESATIQGHEIRFSTVDLTQSHKSIKNRLLNKKKPKPNTKTQQKQKTNTKKKIKNDPETEKKK